MTSLPIVSHQSNTVGVDIDRSFEQWIYNSLERSPDLAQKINLVYRFHIRHASGHISSWVLDLSEKGGALYRQPKADVKCEVTIDESDLLKAFVDKRHLTKVLIDFDFLIC